MTVHYEGHGVTVHYGDCLEVLRTLPDCSVDSVVTDPPYGLEFMGKDWDSFKVVPSGGAGVTATGYTDGATRLARPSFTGSPNPPCRNRGGTQRGADGQGVKRCRCDSPEFPNVRRAQSAAFGAWCEEWAAECLRVLRPGGHMLAFGGTRTWHRLACAVENAGFEIRDTIASGSAMLVWCYGSGFPKSRNISADSLACQCVPDVRDDVVNAAAESAAQVLLSDLHGRSETPGADLAHLHGLPADLRAADAPPGDSEQDLLHRLRADAAVEDEDWAALAESPAASGDDLRPLRSDVPAEALRGAGTEDVLLPVLSGQGARVGADREQVRRHGHDSTAPVRSGEPGMEGRGDVQAAEGQLHRPEVRPMPAGPASDGAVGRVRDGAPTGDGPPDRPPTAAVRGGQPHQPRPEGQPQGEPGAVPVERGSQAWRGWPVCDRCGKPALPPGLGTALKPAFEPIVVARKPLTGTVAANVVAHGTGALNIAATRVAATPEDIATRESRNGSTRKPPISIGEIYGAGWVEMERRPGVATGRWPSNVIFTHAPDCEPVGTRKVRAGMAGPQSGGFGGGMFGDGEPDKIGGGHADADGTETVQVWECAPGCPVAELDVQSGNVGAHGSSRGPSDKRHGDVYGVYAERIQGGHGDSGSASRFFPVFRYQAKADSAERPRAGGAAHPTVKPLDLMRWLVRLVTPPGGLVLDPFAGSGTTAEACLVEGFRCITIEREAEYLPLIVHRITKRMDPAAHLAAQARRGEDVDLGLFGLFDQDGAA